MGSSPDNIPPVVQVLVRLPLEYVWSVSQAYSTLVLISMVVLSGMALLTVLAEHVTTKKY